jgi:hypothetical protein
MERLAGSVDWIETHNARVVSAKGNEQAAAFAARHRIPGVAVSDAHSALEVGVAYTVLHGDLSTPAGMLAALAALPAPELITGRASFYVRLLTPVAKVVQRARGNGRGSSRDDSRAAATR